LGKQDSDTRISWELYVEEGKDWEHPRVSDGNHQTLYEEEEWFRVKFGIRRKSAEEAGLCRWAAKVGNRGSKISMDRYLAIFYVPVKVST